jgi:uncharacterized protein YdeI (YjbR/CyaY-like superfamily)
LKVALKKTAEFANGRRISSIKLDENPALKTAFEALTPGRQTRLFASFFSLRSRRKHERPGLKKHIERIMDGKGLEDQ